MTAERGSGKVAWARNRTSSARRFAIGESNGHGFGEGKTQRIMRVLKFLLLGETMQKIL